jgi:hypothetical protein
VKHRQFSVFFIDGDMPVTDVTSAGSLSHLVKALCKHEILGTLSEETLDPLARLAWKGHVVLVPSMGLMLFPGRHSLALVNL